MKAVAYSKEENVKAEFFEPTHRGLFYTKTSMLIGWNRAPLRTSQPRLPIRKADSCQLRRYLTPLVQDKKNTMITTILTIFVSISTFEQDLARTLSHATWVWIGLKVEMSWQLSQQYTLKHIAFQSTSWNF